MSLHPGSLRRIATAHLSDAEVRAIRQLLWAAFASDDEDDQMTEDDWQHALGGMHFVLEMGGEIVAHASVVERELHVDGRPVRTGYVEAVATSVAHQRTGLGTQVMRDVADFIDAHFELGALGTSSHSFYHRLGWDTWRGPSLVRTPAGLQATPDEDGYILVLRTHLSPPLDLTAPISCDWRAGDVW
jgi:aminoglycoside 2'-N-acetyltransferase I